MTDWPIKTLGEVCDLVNGATPDTKVKDYWGGTHAWITPAEMGGLDSPFLSISRRTLSDKGLASCSATLVPPKTVIISSRAPIGHLVINEVPMATNQGCKSLIPKDGLDFNFLYYYLKANVELLESLGTGTTFKELSGTQLKTVTIPVPALDEQKKIVALLDAATARVTELTSCYEQARTHANNLFTSALRGALKSNPDWPVKTLGEVCELVSRGRPPSYCEVGGVIVLNQKCVRNGQIDFGPSRRTDSSVKAIPEWAYLREGDTLINSTGAGTLGRASFVSFLTEPTTFDTHLTVVRPLRDACWPAFVGLVLNGREKDIVDLAGGATGQTELPREAVRSFEIPVPPLEDQKRIVARLDLMRAKTSEMVAAYDAKLTAAKNLRQSILEAAFGGDL